MKTCPPSCAAGWEGAPIETKTFPVTCRAAEEHTPVRSQLIRQRRQGDRRIPWIPVLLFLWALLGARPLQAEDFTYLTNNGAITITGYTGLPVRSTSPAP